MYIVIFRIMHEKQDTTFTVKKHFVVKHVEVYKEN